MIIILGNKKQKQQKLRDQKYLRQSIEAQICHIGLLYLPKATLTSTPPLFAWTPPRETISDAPHDGSSDRTGSVYSENFAIPSRCICKYPNLRELRGWHENTRSREKRNTPDKCITFHGTN